MAVLFLKARLLNNGYYLRTIVNQLSIMRNIVPPKPGDGIPKFSYAEYKAVLSESLDIPFYKFRSDVSTACPPVLLVSHLLISLANSSWRGNG